MAPWPSGVATRARHCDRPSLPRSSASSASAWRTGRENSAITPPELQFRITTPMPIVMGQGTLIDYRLKLNGVSFGWRTRIAAWDPPYAFVDEQLKGPYAVWHHTHTFADEGGKTRMDDEVLYKLPLWPLGEVAYPFVKSKVEGIFRYRRAKLREILGV